MSFGSKPYMAGVRCRPVGPGRPGWAGQRRHGSGGRARSAGIESRAQPLQPTAIDQHRVETARRRRAAKALQIVARRQQRCRASAVLRFGSAGHARRRGAGAAGATAPGSTGCAAEQRRGHQPGHHQPAALRQFLAGWLAGRAQGRRPVFGRPGLQAKTASSPCPACASSSFFNSKKHLLRAAGPAQRKR